MMHPDDSAADRERALDARLSAAARRGDTRALASLIERHQVRVYRMCLRVTGDEDAAAEATQDALLRAVRAISTFDDRAQFSTWITRIAINACLSRARSEKLRRHRGLDAPIGGFSAVSGQTQTLGNSLPTGEQTPARRVQQDEDRARVLEALAVLDVEARTILLLRDGHDLEYDQIAEMLGVAIGTVKSRLFRARVALREAMESKRK
ncbi:MAG: sigma-70 family RNA polymerase sigma factor [Phycisphaeraceae bacterium]|nr:sigma-70 family RNA polymerase sigma factor [Phycisphaeraceae bacterium]